MISVTAGTKSYILQPSLIEMHKKSLEWLSASVLWKRELKFFQHLLEKQAPSATSVDDKKKIDHFQNLIIYYSGELVDELRKKLRDHENSVARMLQEKNESDTGYFQDHQNLMDELQTFSDRFQEYKHELFDFIERKA